MLNPNHMLPDKRQLITRALSQYELPKCNAERYENGFVSWCHVNCHVVKY